MIGNIVSGALFILIGILAVITLINHSFVIPKIPKSEKWQRIRVKSNGVKTYIEKNISGTRALPPYRKETACVITYAVNGVVYEKTVPHEKNVTHIFIKKSNPGYFKTIAEIKAAKCKNNVEKISTVVEIFISLCLVFFGVFIIVTTVS